MCGVRTICSGESAGAFSIQHFDRLVDLVEREDKLSNLCARDEREIKMETEIIHAHKPKNKQQTNAYSTIGNLNQIMYYYYTHTQHKCHK